MYWLIAILSIALVAALAWALILRRRTPAPVSSEPVVGEQFSRLFQAVADEFDAGLLVFDHDKQVRYANHQAETLLDLNRAHLNDQGLIAVLRNYQAEALVDDVQRDGETRELELQPLANGRRIRLHAARYSDNDAPLTIVLLHDVTQLTNLERARRDIVANVSHELRNPLASVKLLVETLQTSPPAPVANRMLAQMAQEVDAITQLVDELHELSQIESGRVLLQLRPTAIQPVITRAVERMQPQAERKSIQISADVAPSLPLALIDDARIGQVLLNLLHNAVKFTSQDGVITVRVRRLEIGEHDRGMAFVEEVPASETTAVQRTTLAVPMGLAAGDWLLLSVEDTGVGIPAQDLPRIFERFYKVDRARTRNAGGTGLGLAIAKHLVEGHGGRIWATSHEGQGSIFYFALPVA